MKTISKYGDGQQVNIFPKCRYPFSASSGHLWSDDKYSHCLLKKTFRKLCEGKRTKTNDFHYVSSNHLDPKHVNSLFCLIFVKYAEIILLYLY